MNTYQKLRPLARRYGKELIQWSERDGWGCTCTSMTEKVT